MRHPMIRIGGMQPRDIDQIGDDRAGGRLGTGPRAVIKRRADRIAFDQDRVHHAFHIGDQTARRNQRRMHAQLDAVGHAFGDAQQLDAITELLGILNIFARQL